MSRTGRVKNVSNEKHDHNFTLRTTSENVGIVSRKLAQRF